MPSGCYIAAGPCKVCEGSRCSPQEDCDDLGEDLSSGKTTTPNKATATQRRLQNDNINVLPRLRQSHDLSPNENLWPTRKLWLTGPGAMKPDRGKEEWGHTASSR